MRLVRQSPGISLALPLRKHPDPTLRAIRRMYLIIVNARVIKRGSNRVFHHQPGVLVRRRPPVSNNHRSSLPCRRALPTTSHPGHTFLETYSTTWTATKNTSLITITFSNTRRKASCIPSYTNKPCDTSHFCTLLSALLLST